MYTSPCTAPAPHSAPVLASTDPHEPTAKQQTTEPSHCQSTSSVFMSIICETLLCYKAFTKACIHKNAQYTCMHILARYTNLPTCTIIIASINVSFHVPCTAPAPHPPPVMTEPHPVAKQQPTEQPSDQQSEPLLWSVLYIYGTFCVSWHGTVLLYNALVIELNL